MEAIIQTYQLTKKFKGEEVIKPLDFSLRKGEICALIGKNGAGKSTFLKLLGTANNMVATFLLFSVSFSSGPLAILPTNTI